MSFETVTIGSATLYRSNGRGVNEHVLRGSLPASFRFGCLPCHYSDDAQPHYLTTHGQDVFPFLHGVPVLDIVRLFLSLSPRTHLRHVFSRFDSLGDILRIRLQFHVANIRNSWLGRVSMSEIAQFSPFRNHTSIPKDGLSETPLGSVLNRKVQQDGQSDCLKYQELTLVDYLKRCM